MSHSGAGIVEGRTVSHYRIVKKLGGGGMGIVYKAEDVRLNRFVALKFLSPHLTQNETAKSRFIREAQAASALDHPNVCAVHDIEETPHGQLFICMPYYDGETLDRRLARSAMPLDEAIGIVAKIAAGLEHAHSQGIIHRDIKPANIMLTRDGGLRILDFGLAKLKGTARITRTSATTMGTCDYMSPEQILGAEVDRRSDIFSLGIVLYELIAGQTPFHADHPEAVMYQIVHKEPRPLKELRPQVKPRLQRIVDHALNKNVANRYRTASEMESDLTALLDRGFPAWRRFKRAILFRARGSS
jgi:serine/threonine protein kinase